MEDTLAILIYSGDGNDSVLSAKMANGDSLDALVVMTPFISILMDIMARLLLVL